ncbi:MAG: PilZ domain-containing protein [Pyrinomonadaceae bacterium]|nr:PilZ domain-containing protein [Pyrinomonadaceae bacterium]
MGGTDRRSGIDRRKTRRARVNTPIEWESHSGKRTGTVSDLSRDGCFVLTSGDVSAGERIFINFPLTDGGKARLPAEIGETVFDIGFAAKFVGLTVAQNEFLERFVELNMES